MDRLTFAVCSVLLVSSLLLQTARSTGVSVTYDQPCSSRGGTDLDIFCGRGSSGECPGQSYCDIHPADRFATCCCSDPAATCPNCSVPVNCFADPCRVNSCPAFPGATCRSDDCSCSARFFVKGKEVTDQCSNDEPCSSRGGTDLDIFCGRGSSGECPGSSYCDIHPADRFATCCCNNPAAICPGCSVPVNCFANPCDVNTCPHFPKAVCKPDFCGGCNARFFFVWGWFKFEVTKFC